MGHRLISKVETMICSVRVYCLVAIFLSVSGEEFKNTWTDEELEFLSELKEEFAKEIKSLKEEIQELKNDRHASSQKSRRLLVGNTVQPIAFYAHLSATNNGSFQHAVLYDTVPLNYGNAYNKFSGIFRAPVSGIYHFTNTVMSKSGSSIHVNIVKNGNPIAWNFADYEGWESGSTTVIVELEAGDSVWVRDDDTGVKYMEGRYNNFSGFLMYKV